MMACKCILKSKHGNRIVISGDESNSENDYESSSFCKGLSDTGDDIDQMVNDTDSNSEENWLEYETSSPLKRLSDVENEVDAIEEEDVELTRESFAEN